MPPNNKARKPPRQSDRRATGRERGAPISPSLVALSKSPRYRRPTARAEHGQDGWARIHKAADKLRKLSRLKPSLAIILGSGFHPVLSELELDAKIDYSHLPGFPRVGVPGHSGELLIGRLGGTPVMLLGGRTHFYEGHSMAQVTYAVRTIATYGIADLLITNAAGGINRSFKPGDFMLLTDHINFLGTNPLRGPTVDGLSGFVDLSCAYDPGLRSLLLRAGHNCGIRLRRGVYLAVCGPSYETPAEIRAFARLGADAVGMSTVPEAIVARQHGLRVAGISCITNLAAGCGGEALSHAKVLKTGEKVKTLAANLLKQFAILYAG